jgi:hypothetical protein
MPNATATLRDVIADVARFRDPRIVAFNRLEARPRTLDFTRSLRAEIRDPLWMLTRQWQLGEFKAEDAASPVTTRIAYRHHPVDRVALADGAAAPFDPSDLPLETYVEREPVPLIHRERGDGEIYSDVLFAARWGKRFLDALRKAGLDSHHGAYQRKFPIRVLSLDPTSPDAGFPDVEAKLIADTLMDQVADGVAVWRYVLTSRHDSWLDSEPGGDKPALKTLAATFAQGCSAELGRMFSSSDPAGQAAWLSDHLEYSFAVGGRGERDAPGPVLVADQYSGGRLDWHGFDFVHDHTLSLDGGGEGLELVDEVESFLPGPVRFKGQPQPRFWQMEEAQIDFGKIETSATGLLHMMLAEFGLLYGNDWFMLPHPMPVNVVCEIRGILVDDTFGRHTYVQPAGAGSEAAWQRFAMFHQTERDGQAKANLFFLVPSVAHVLESPPLERVNFVRDEMANMAWGVETIVPSQLGTGLDGDRLSRPAEPPPGQASDTEVTIRYLAGTSAPKNWIPFIPVQLDERSGQIALQRARVAGGRPPRGLLLREPGSPYFVAEEEVPRAGVYVERAWQRARWIRGRTLTWVGRRKTAGRGEGSSGLGFDRLVDVKTLGADG